MTEESRDEINPDEPNHSLIKWGDLMIEFAHQATKRAALQRISNKNAPRLFPDDFATMSNIDLIEALSERLIKAGKMLAGLGNSMPTIRKEIQLTTTQKVRRAQSAKKSIHGTHGAIAKHVPHQKIKAWALESSKNIKGSLKDKSRHLAKIIPPNLKFKNGMDGEEVSKEPERLIYEHLRADSNNARQAMRNG